MQKISGAWNTLVSNFSSMPIIFNGREFARNKEKILRNRIIRVSNDLNRKPKLVAVGIGNKKDIDLYLSMKEMAARRLGVDFEKQIFKRETDGKTVVNFIKEKNSDSKVDGILLELPVPKSFQAVDLMAHVSPSKDPDCMTNENLGRLLYGSSSLLPATVRAIREILALAAPSSFSKPFSFKNSVVVGGGVELGKPLAMLLSDMGSAVSLCRSTTKNLKEFTKNADIIVSAVGKPDLITADMVKNHAVIIDAGINFMGGKTIGDVNFPLVSQKASFITPVPGGVGPVTIECLFENLIDNLIKK